MKKLTKATHHSIKKISAKKNSHKKIYLGIGVIFLAIVGYFIFRPKPAQIMLLGSGNPNRAAMSNTSSSVKVSDIAKSKPSTTVTTPNQKTNTTNPKSDTPPSNAFGSVVGSVHSGTSSNTNSTVSTIVSAVVGAMGGGAGQLVVKNPESAVSGAIGAATGAVVTNPKLAGSAAVGGAGQIVAKNPGLAATGAIGAAVGGAGQAILNNGGNGGKSLKDLSGKPGDTVDCVHRDAEGYCTIVSGSAGNGGTTGGRSLKGLSGQPGTTVDCVNRDAEGYCTIKIATTTPTTGGSNPSNGASCKGATTNIASGAWAQSGKAYGVNPSDRECVQCINGQWGEKANCNSVPSIPRPDEVIEGKTDNAACWKNNAWYATSQSIDGQECSKGHWCGVGQTWDAAGKQCVAGTANPGSLANTQGSMGAGITKKCEAYSETDYISNCGLGQVQVTTQKSDCSKQVKCSPVAGGVHVTNADNSSLPNTFWEFAQDKPVRAIMSTSAGAVTGAVAGFGACAVTGVLIVISPVCALVGAGVGGYTGNSVGNSISNAQELINDPSLPQTPTEFFKDKPVRATMSTTAGAATGCAAGSAIGSIVPIAGNIAGCALGSLLGGYIGNTVGNNISNAQELLADPALPQNPIEFFQDKPVRATMSTGAGFLTGCAAGNAIGSIIPIAGNIAGCILGGALGGYIGNSVGNIISNEQELMGGTITPSSGNEATPIINDTSPSQLNTAPLTQTAGQPGGNSFGGNNSSGQNSNRNFTHFYQGDYGNGIKENGCYLTTGAMIIANYGTVDRGANPEQLNDKYLQGKPVKSGYITVFDGNAYDKNGIKLVDVSKEAQGNVPKYVASHATESQPLTLAIYCDSCYAGGHFVLVVGENSNGEPLIYDPLKKDQTNPIALNSSNYPGLNFKTTDVHLVETQEQ